MTPIKINKKALALTIAIWTFILIVMSNYFEITIIAVIVIGVLFLMALSYNIIKDLYDG